jgi:hypothetical protein
MAVSSTVISSRYFNKTKMEKPNKSKNAALMEERNSIEILDFHGLLLFFLESF